MPYSIFKRHDLGELRPTIILLQLAHHSVKHPLDILEEVPINVCDSYMPEYIVILNMDEDAHTQIILGRPFLATARCKIDVKKGRLTFDVGEHHVEFGLYKGYGSSLLHLLIMVVMCSFLMIV